MGLVLFFVSILLGIFFIPLGLIYGFYRNFYDTHIGNAFIKTNAKLKKMAIAMDILGNVYGEELLNDTLITKDAVDLFGLFGITISAVLGSAQKHSALTRTGKVIVFILNKIERDHCLLAYNLSSISKKK